MTALRAILGISLGLAVPAHAEPCRDVVFETARLTICEVLAGDDLRLFLTGPDGAAHGSFQRVNATLQAEGNRLGFAMNAGMFHSDRRPVGLYREAGQDLAPLVSAPGPGNFGMLPNGVFCIRQDGSYAVIETRAFAARGAACRDATQSGPMLVVGGRLHPRFIPDSPSRFVRNGVGVSPDGRRAVFAISQSRVNFHEFARFFRDGLGFRDALYFDGNVSRLHAPGLGRSDFGFPMGPIVGLVVPEGEGRAP